MSRYRTQRTREGHVIQAGLDPRARNATSPMQPKLGLYRAIVLQTYVPQLNDGTDNPDNFRRFQIECDVLLVRSQIELRQVPVIQQQGHGINNAAPWVPKPTTRTLSGNRDLNFNVVSRRGQFVAPATGLDDHDGDMVIVEFVEGMLDYPVITGALTHERTNRIVRQGAGWNEASAGAERGKPEENEHYTHHKGAEVRINDDGEVLVDTVGAYTDPATETITADKGQIRFRVKDELKFTVECDGVDVLEVYKQGGTVHIDLGEGATEHIVLGDAFRALYNAHKHSSPAGGSTGIPVIQMDLVPGTHTSLTHRVK